MPRKLVDIGKGEPDFHTPEHVKEAAYAAIAENFTKYTPQPGIRELREAIAHKFASENGIRVAPEQIVVSCGGKHCVDNAIRCIVEPGDQVIVMTPHWFAYPQQVRWAGGTPVLVPAREAEGFLPEVEAIEAAITPATRAIVLNSPCNPTGAVYPRKLLERIARLAVEGDLTVIADEVYENIVFDGAEHISIASLDEAIAARTVTVNSVSKTHAMTGWRIGYAALPAALAERVIALQSVSTSAPSAVGQRAALVALTGDQAHVAAMTAAYAERRNLVLERIARIPQLSTTRPMGTFYCFVNIGALIGRIVYGETIRDADDFVKVVREGAGVSVVSGTTFGSDLHIRVSFAVHQEALEEGFNRIEELLAASRKGV